jgi:hypothetical protein
MPCSGQGHRQPHQTDGLPFFDSYGVVCINHVPRGTTMHANYIIGALLMFMKAPGRKNLTWCPGSRCPLGHWSSVHHAETSEVSCQEDIQIFPHPPLS